MSDDPTRFLVVGPWRTGTKYTLRGISDHDDVTAQPIEVVPWPLFSAGLDFFVDYHSGGKQRRQLVRAAFDQLSCNGQPRTTRVTGIKTALRDAPEAFEVVLGLQRYLEDVRVVVTRRADMVARFASTWRATGPGPWHATVGHEIQPAERARLPAPAFRRFLQENHAVDTALQMLTETHQVSIVDYERDVLGGGGLDHVFTHLGLEPHGKTNTEAKVSPPLESWIDNIDELRTVERETNAPTAADVRAQFDEYVAGMLAAERPGARLERARFLQRLKQFEQAFVMARDTLLALQGPVLPDQARALRILKWCFRHSRDTDVMRRSLDALRERYEATPEFHELEAELALQLGRFDEADTHLQKARTAEPDCESEHRLTALADEIERRRRK